MEQISKRLYSWATILEPQAREQAERTAAMPFVWPHLALMPDAHHRTQLQPVGRPPDVHP